MTDPAHKRANAPHRLGITMVPITVFAAGSSMLPIGAAEHTVAPGEALSIIAAEHAVSVETLVELNDLDNPDLIYVGQVIDLPNAAPEEPTQEQAGGSHTVSAGDSLWAIASRYGMALETLASLNGVENPSLIFPGQVLALSVPSSSTPESSESADDEPADGDAGLDDGGDTDVSDGAVMVHEVVAGDTLSAIASRYSLSLDVLLSTNDLDLASVIVPGQRIVIATSVADIDPAVLANLPEDLVGDPDRLALLPVFDRWADHYGVPADLTKSLAWFESGWNHEVVSSAGALGIGQVLPITADFVSDVLIGETLDPLVPEENIRLSIRYLRYLLDETDDVRLAIASYYQGLTATRRHGIYTSSQFYVDGIIALRDRFA